MMACSSNSPSLPLWYSFDSDDIDSNSSIIPSIDQVGGKGLSLIRCHQAGFDVPEGVVLSVSFFEPWLRQIEVTLEYQQAFKSSPDYSLPNRQDCDAVKAKCCALTLLPEQKQALHQALDVFRKRNNNQSSALIAVRSSAPQEDSSQASLAGVYLTTLGVRLDNEKELVQALVDSFASALDYRVAAVSEEKLDLRLAVILQRQLDSEASGVAFSLDPQSNCYDEAVISANRGLGESVVAGVVTPDTYKVDKIKQVILSKQVSENKTTAYVLNKEAGSGVMEQRNEDPMLPALTDEQVLQVASLVTKVESFMGLPIDIEWAFQDGNLFLLQARPITTYVKLFPEMLSPPGERKNLYIDVIVMSQGFSDPMSVLGMDIWGRMLRAAKPQFKPGPEGTIWEIHGREYMHLSNMLAVYGGQSMVRKMLEAQGGQLIRILDVVNLKDYVPAKPTEKNKYFLWDTMKSLALMIPVMVRGMWDWEKAMDAYLEKWNEIFERFGPCGKEEMRGEITFGQAVDDAMGAFSELIPLVGGLLMSLYSKWRLHKMFDGDRDTQDLLVALNMDLDGNPTSAMGHAMLHLASFPEVNETATGDEFVRRLNTKAFSDEFQAAYDDFIGEFGCRGMKEIDIATPRSYEDQAHLFDRIKLIDVESNQILTVKHRKADAYNSLLERASQRRNADAFKYHANIIQKLGGYREHPKYVYVFLVAYLRRRALKLADKFMKEGRLGSTLAIFDLGIEEITEAEMMPDLNLLECIERNKAPYLEVAHVKDWPQVIDSRGKILRGLREDVEDGIGGDPISPGKVTGRARVLTSPYEKPLTRGEILITKATEPSWTPIFLNASGVVLEIGGPLQHGAIIAREYGIPCVSGVQNATTLICDGQLIQVDGTNGIIKIIEEESKDDKKEASSDGATM